ncbi:unnamed protein product, partial [Prorocentrum cordatum]
ATIMNGWEEFLNRDARGTEVSWSTYVKCQACGERPAAREAALRAGRRAATAEPARAPAIRAALQLWEELVSEHPGALGDTPAFRWGPRFKEVFAGTAGVTRAVKQLGIQADEPVELYRNPLHPKESEWREDHDLSNPDVAEALVKEADTSPGPGVANVWMFENPCTSFCDHNTKGGTRTWEKPEGTGVNGKEVLGNALSQTTVRCMRNLHKWRKGWIFENQEHRGIYPKVYDLPEWLEILEETGAVIIPGTMCAWGLHPSDASSPHQFYRKGYWLVVSANLAPFFTKLRRPCPGLSPVHQHVELRDNVPGTGIKRTRKAAQYPPRFARAVALAIWTDWAQELCTQCADKPKYSPEVVKEGARLGDGLVQAAGDWKEAVDCYREAWTSRWGNNLVGVFKDELCELLDPDLRDYLHQMVKGGVPARQPLAQVRVPSKPHMSVQGHMEEAMEKLWKRDIAEAFRWIWLRAEDAGMFATELPGKVVGMEGNLVAIYLVLTFGWIGGPGEYMAFGTALKQCHDRHRPADPGWHDDVPHHSHLLMDDDVLSEPLLGRRPWTAARLAEEGARRVFGPLAINAEKKEKVNKIRILLSDPAYDTGNTQVALKDVQVLRGTLNFAAITCPPLRPELGAVDRLLRTADPAGVWVKIKESSEGREKDAWDEWWEALEVFRLYAGAPQAWTTHFNTGLKGVLQPQERLALPGGMEELVWTGGDATETRVGAADRSNGVYGVMDVKEVMEPFHAVFGEGADIIAICELFTFLVLAVAQEMNRLGLEEIDLKGPWREVLAGAEKGRPLVLPGDSEEGRRLAYQLVERRRARGPPAGPLAGVQVFEWRATLSPYCRVAGEMGARIGATTPNPGSAVSHPWWEVHQNRLVAERAGRARTAVKETWVTCSSGSDPTGREALYFVRHALSHAATFVVLDGPLDQDLGEAREVLAWRDGGNWGSAALALLRRGERLVPLNLSSALLTPEAVPPELYMQEEEGRAHWRHFKVPERADRGEGGRPTALQAAGTWKSTRESEGDVRVILSPMSSGPDPLWHPDEVSGHYPVLLEDTRGDGTPRVRRFDPKGAWQISGGLLHDWREGTRAGVPEEVLLMGAARSMPPVSARQVLWAAAGAREGLLAKGARAGVRRDPDEDFMAAANATWFSAWKANPEDPRTAYERWLREARGARAG